jgi:hypothetical protein
LTEAPSRRVFGREALVLAVLVAALLGVVMAFGAARNGSGYLFNSDAIFFRRVATDPFGNGSAFAGYPHDVGVAYRYGRILYPLSAWILAAGRPGLITWTMPVVYVLSIGLMVACACELCVTRGIPAVRGLWVLLVPSMWVTVPIVFSDPFVVSLVLLVYLLSARGRAVPMYLAAAALLLAREAAALALLPLVLRDLRRRDVRAALMWVATALPLLDWWTWIRVRMGVWPPLDPAYGRRGALSLPFAGVIQVIREGKPLAGFFLAAIILGAVTVVAGLYVWRRAGSTISEGAVLFALLILCLGPSAVRLPAQMIRLMLPAQVLIALALVAATQPASEAPA